MIPFSGFVQGIIDSMSFSSVVSAAERLYAMEELSRSFLHFGGGGGGYVVRAYWCRNKYILQNVVIY